MDSQGEAAAPDPMEEDMVVMKKGAGAAAREDALFINSLAKGLSVLKAFDGDWDALGLSEIAGRSGISMGAAQRITHTLVRLGYLRKDDRTRRYRLSARTLDFAYHYLHASPLYEVSIPFVASARDECRETVNVAELDGPEVVAVIRMPSQRYMNPTSTIGRRLPAFCTAGGRAQLAWLPPAEAANILDRTEFLPRTPHTLTDRADVEKRLELAQREGYAMVVEEVNQGEIALAAPILDGNGRPLAAVGVSTSTADWTADSARERLAPVVMQTARLISRSLKGWKPF
ncbi:IclR family transcriptional regulator [Microvirga sp. 17 mud 1-3]|uniref:IclR family transcriptional regulator n=1 Tax=Microvirga sp. 17 mud 1-3 TaxID=2082949 RepID=UPI000D6BCF68|nr:IclR family transcriptional regulator C-terminal domain-containing protein [Microvirga sp. 17 mud 1-3]AWM87060.1 IclR family transcriptional regulator [Microvirga sp. 17 mud 1-3]